jgi:hypothetical protein
MAVPKRKTNDCPIRVACDGRAILPSAPMCNACREALARREQRRKENPE